MSNRSNKSYQKGFLPYALAAFLIGLIGGLSTVLGPAFFQPAYLRPILWTLISLVGLFLVEKKASHPILSASFIKRKEFVLPVIILFLT